MPNLVICEKPGDLKGIGPDSIVIISRRNLISLLTPERTRRLKKIFDSAKEYSTKSKKNWFQIPISDVEIHEITNGLRRINKNIKILNEKIVPLDLIQALQSSGIVPVIII